MALYTNEGNGLFIDEAPSSTIGRTSLLSLTFACFFFDYDLDGAPDIFAANGHVADDIQTVQSRVPYAQRPHLYRNLGKRRFEEVTARSGAALVQPMVARGAAHADYDLDGDPDLLVTTNNGPARLLRNDGGDANGALRVVLRGTQSNKNGIGAHVAVRGSDGRIRRQMVKTGSSYLSQSELPLIFGLGPSTSLGAGRQAEVQSIEVTWPSGRIDRLAGEKGGQILTIEEGRGIVARATLQ